MILGIGLDLLDTKRIKKIFDKFKNHLIKKILSEEEKKEFKLIANNNKSINFLTKKFSAKESFVKAVGLGLGRGIFLKDITISHDNLGRPIIKLQNNAKNFIEEYFKIDFSKLNIIITITDNGNFINTLVILEKMI